MSNETDAGRVREVTHDVLREMYDEAEPGLDFDDVVENPGDYPERWYDQHTLSKERQREIVDKHAEQNNLTESEENSVYWTAVLDLGPRYGDDE